MASDSKKWGIVKKQFNMRPMLPYILGMPLEEYQKYMYETPPSEYVNLYYEKVENDRKEKTQKIKEELKKVVGYRESCQYARIFNVSDTTVREVIEGKKKSIGYDMIDKLEIYLHAISGMKLSVGNMLSPQYCVDKEFRTIEKSLDEIAFELMRFPEYFKKCIESMSVDLEYKSDTVSLLASLEQQVHSLQDIIDRLQTLVDLFMKKNNIDWLIELKRE